MQRNALHFVLPLLGSLLYLSPSACGEEKEKNAAVQAAAALYDGIREVKLDNGLRVYLKPIPGATTVSTMTAYKVGSSDEDLEHTGLSHYLEHLMFKGTKTIFPGDIDRKTLKNGGANNAYTSEDYTIYHFDFAADRWEIALEIEADRMRNLVIDEKHEFQQEKGAVINELARNEDEPWDLELKAILPLLFGKTAPYGHSVIGEREHVKEATAEVIKSHYDKWYHPNNASLIVCGGFDSDKALEKIKKLFGSIPAGKLPERKKIPDEKLSRPARLEMESKFTVPRLLMGFNTVKIGDPDDPVLDVIQGLLTGGKTGRLYRKFVEGEEIATEVSAGNYAGRYPGWFALQMELFPDKDRAAAEKMLLEELKKLHQGSIEPVELKRVKQTILTDLVFARESVHGLADSIARGVTTNDMDYLKSYFPKLQSVTAEDVKRVAKKYFDPEQRVVVWSLPAKKPGKIEGSGTGKDKEQQHRRTYFDKPAGEGLSLKKAERVELANGLVLLLYENHRLPVITAQAVVRRIQIHEPADKAGVAALTGMLLEEGTAKHSGTEIAEIIEDVGGTLSMGYNGGSVRVLSDHRRLALDLLFECLTQPTFKKEEFERQKQRLLTSIDDADVTPETRARLTFHEAVYGKHPFNRPPEGKRKTIEPLQPADCAAFHSRVFVPGNTLLAVAGDFDKKQLVEEIGKITSGWKTAKVTVPKLPDVEKPADLSQKIITMPDAAQLHVYIGHVGIRRNNQDYYKLLVLDYVLGTGPGFTDRLSANLRDRQGLAYTVNANITSTAGEEPGLFNCYIGTDPDNFDKVKRLIFEEFNRIRDTVPSKDEVEDVKQYLLGSLAFRLADNSSILQLMLNAEQNQLGFGYLDDYRKAVAAVTPEEVQAVAKKYLDPKKIFVIAAGPIDAKGKVIPTEKGSPKE